MVLFDDALDAMLCACIARAVATGQALGPDEPVRAGALVPPSSRVADPLAALEGRAERAEALRLAAAEHAHREGWIYVPQHAALGEALLGRIPTPAQTDRAAAATTPAAPSWATMGDACVAQRASERSAARPITHAAESRSGGTPRSARAVAPADRRRGPLGRRSGALGRQHGTASLLAAHDAVGDQAQDQRRGDEEQRRVLQHPVAAGGS